MGGTVLQTLFSTKKWSDCTFIVGQSATNIKAHRNILAAASSVFETMFYGNIPEDCKKPIVVNDMTENVFNDLLKFIYCDETLFEDIKSVENILYGAEKYMIQELKGKCLDYLNLNVSVSNVISIITTGVLYEDQTLINTCLEVIKDHTYVIFNGQQFLDIPLSVLLLILECRRLKLESEELLLKYVIQYAVHNDYICCSLDGATKINNAEIYKAFYNIRFLSMSAKGFASMVDKCRGILTDNELIELLTFFCDPTINIGLSGTFNLSRNKRCVYQK